MKNKALIIIAITAFIALFASCSKTCVCDCAVLEIKNGNEYSCLSHGGYEKPISYMEDCSSLDETHTTVKNDSITEKTVTTCH